jgi:hypothetical protein
VLILDEWIKWGPAMYLRTSTFSTGIPPRKRILRYLEKRDVFTIAAAPATAQKRAPIRLTHSARPRMAGKCRADFSAALPPPIGGPMPIF